MTTIVTNIRAAESRLLETVVAIMTTAVHRAVTKIKVGGQGAGGTAIPRAIRKRLAEIVETVAATRMTRWQSRWILHE